MNTILVPAASAASATRTVPTTFRSASRAGSRTDVCTSVCAARWKTTSIPLRSIPSRMSPATNRAASLTYLAPAEREVVDHGDLVAAGDEHVDEIGADEAGASGYRSVHTPYRRRSMFISFEGQDGSGKTTQVGLLVDWLRNEGHEVVSSREPGGTPIGEAIRDVVLHGLEMTPWTEAALFASARAEHVSAVIRPSLERGAWVVLDRYVDSSLVYQGIARGLGVQEVLDLNNTVTGGLMPARTFVLVLDAVAARDRQNGYLDRIEREDARLPGRRRRRLPRACRPLPGTGRRARRLEEPRGDRRGGS